MNRVLVISLLIFVGVAILFVALIPIGATYLYGWIFSAAISLIGYLFGLWVINMTLKSKTKNKGRALSFVRIFLLYILHIVAVIVIVWVDKHESGLSLWRDREMKSLYGPINIFTYLGGVAVIPISTLIAHFPSRKGR